MSECHNSNCYVSDGASCPLGHISLSACPQWNKASGNTDIETAEAGEILLPWNGAAMGLSDLNFVTGRAKPTVVGIAGAESAGKTTMLGAWYLLLGNGSLRMQGHRFSASYSLAGWEAVAASLRWEPGQPPTFPPHTSSRAARAPGTLHLGLRRGDGSLHDMVFADAPGEWFQRWANDENDVDAEGARWVSRNADVMLLIADREALVGPKRGPARNAFQVLAKRVAAQGRGRPVALVWTKGDVAVDSAMEAQIRAAVHNEIPHAPEFTVSVKTTDHIRPAQGLSALFNWVASTRRGGVVLPMTRTVGHDPLFRVGRR